MNIEWIKNRRPTAEDADRDGHVRLAFRDSTYTLAEFESVASGATWAHTQRWHEEHPKKQVLSGWINDRLPEIHDSDVDGDVELPNPAGAGEVCVPWQGVVAGQTWRHCFGANQHRQSVVIGGRAFRYVTGVMDGANLALIAIANDGTAWLQRPAASGHWLPIDDLPTSREVDNEEWKTGETFIPSTENIQEVTCDTPVVGIPVPLCVRLPVGDDLDKDGNCLYGYWDSGQGGGRWVFSYQDKAFEEDTHWIRYDTEALPETCYKPANVD